jgi:hypothetical protein
VSLVGTYGLPLGTYRSSRARPRLEHNDIHLYAARTCRRDWSGHGSKATKPDELPTLSGGSWRLICELPTASLPAAGPTTCGAAARRSCWALMRRMLPPKLDPWLAAIGVVCMQATLERCRSEGRMQLRMMGQSLAIKNGWQSSGQRGRQLCVALLPSLTVFIETTRHTGHHHFYFCAVLPILDYAEERNDCGSVSFRSGWYPFRFGNVSAHHEP